MSIEMLGPDRSEITITPIDGRLAIIMTNAIAAAICRIDARSILSAIVISAACARSTSATTASGLTSSALYCRI